MIVYYNSEKPHQHLNELSPDTWASKARTYPEQTHIFKKKETGLSKVPDEFLELSQEVLIDRIEQVKELKSLPYKSLERESKEILANIIELSKYEAIPFVPLSKNDNSTEAKIIKKFKKNLGSLSLIDSVKEKRIDLSELDPVTQKMYEEVSQDTEAWTKRDIRYLETIVLQNQILLSNIEELKEQTKELKLQNEELLDMTHYLVETALKAEESKRLVLERKQKRQSAKKLQKKTKETPKGI